MGLLKRVGADGLLRILILEKLKISPIYLKILRTTGVIGFRRYGQNIPFTHSQ
jgi:hypothetical protein